MSGNKKYYSLNGGVSLILLVFIILSLVSFAALSVASACADRRLSDKYMEQTSGYYRAYSEAQEYLAGIYEGGETAPAAENAAADSAAADGFIEKHFPISETQDLVVRLDMESGPDVISIDIVSTAGFDYDESLPVIRR
jgi:hypothetical protein